MTDTKEIGQLIEKIKDDIITHVTNYPLLLGFSGGLDSTALAYVCADALGHGRVQLVHVIYGPYTYSKTLENVLKTAELLKCKLTFVDMRSTQEKVLRNGPSCNRCTKKVKIAGVKCALKDESLLTATGANLSDSWGEYGFKIMNGVYAPFLELDKSEIQAILSYYKVNQSRVKIGESVHREGCKAKHLLKMLVVPHYHGHSVCLSNEIILDILENIDFKAQLANVKIIGPLSTNIALINIKPLPEKEVTDEIQKRLQKTETIDEVKLV
ncbi:MAG: ExsB family protein, partial [Thermotogota bacterium]|nr:ExsB family protein [Thermotogota bacterium]